MKVGSLVREHSTKCPQRYHAVGVVMKIHGGHPWSTEVIQIYWNDTNKLEWSEARELEAIEGRYSCNSTNSSSIPIPNTVRKP
jgi:hypothetical protein